MPSTTSSSVSSDFASSTVITPSLPTFFMASERKRPISWSPLAEMVPTWAISSFDVTFLEFFCRSATTASTARSIPRLRSIGFMPAATALAPSLTMAAARTVAVVVPSPAMSDVLDATSRTIWAPMFSNLSSSSISLATVTPSLVMRGAPKLLSSTTLRPLGPSVTFTALARISTPRSIFSRASPAKRTSFAAISSHSIGLFERPTSASRSLTGLTRQSTVSGRGSMPRSSPGMTIHAVIGSNLHESTSSDDAHDVGLLHDQEFLAVELDLGARPLAEQHPVAGLDVGLDDLAGLVAATWAHRNDLTLRRLLLGSVGNDDAALRFFLGIDAFHDHPIVQGTELGFGHMLSS